MRTWILFSAFWLAETINPGMEYEVLDEVWAIALFFTGIVLDITDFNRK